MDHQVLVTILIHLILISGITLQPRMMVQIMHYILMAYRLKLAHVLLHFLVENIILEYVVDLQMLMALHKLA